MDEMGNELLAAHQRVLAAQTGTVNAKRRLSKAEKALVTARSEVEAALSEEKTAMSALETILPKLMRLAMKKNGNASVAMADVMLRHLSGATESTTPSAEAGSDTSEASIN